MAKAKTLAALAGLAGLAYAYNKNKNKDESKTDTGDETDRLKGRGTPEEGPRRKIEDYQKKAPEAEDANYGNESRRTSMGVAPAPKTVTPKAPSKPTVAKQAPSDPRLAETGTSRGRPAVAKNPNYSNEGRNSVAPAKNPNYSNEGRSSTAPSRVGDAVKTVAKTVAQGPAGVMATTAKPVADKAANAMRETYRDLSGKIQYKTPDIPSAAKTASDAVGDALSKPFRAIREAGNRGNPDVKMASGGMTASRRGDGIAQRGKTRGKMC